MSSAEIEDSDVVKLVMNGVTAIMTRLHSKWLELKVHITSDYPPPWPAAYITLQCYYTELLRAVNISSI